MNHSAAYQTLTFLSSSEHQEILIAMLEQIGFEAFEQKESSMVAYIQSENLTEEILHDISTRLSVWYESYEKVDLPQKNWNVAWESSFQPILVDQFCAIRASFHEPITSVQYEMVIDPRMAFGTGHHETTWMMIKHMATLEIKNADILDFGAGTGILAILASQMGANRVDAVEIDPVAIDNCKHNVALNGQHRVESILGGIDVVPNFEYDIILANVNKNVILQCYTELAQHLKKGGKIVFSGILIEQEGEIYQELIQSELTWIEKVKKNDWISIILTKE